MNRNEGYFKFATEKVRSPDYSFSFLIPLFQAQHPLYMLKYSIYHFHSLNHLAILIWLFENKGKRLPQIIMQFLVIRWREHCQCSSALLQIMLSFSHLPHLPFPSLSSVSHQSFRRCYALPARPRVGWIGLGVMGNPMAGHMFVSPFSLISLPLLITLPSLSGRLAADYPVTVYTRTKSKAAQLIDKGAVWADSPRCFFLLASLFFILFHDDTNIVLSPFFDILSFLFLPHSKCCRERIRRGVFDCWLPAGRGGSHFRRKRSADGTRSSFLSLIIIHVIAVTDQGLSPSGVIVDMTTSRPSLAVTIASEAEKKGCVFIDAPVSGGDVGARNGKLSIMVGGMNQSS